MSGRSVRIKGHLALGEIEMGSKLTLSDVLAMSQQERTQRVSPDLARKLGLEVIDGPPGTSLFIGTKIEMEQRTQGMVGALQHGRLVGRRF